MIWQRLSLRVQPREVESACAILESATRSKCAVEQIVRDQAPGRILPATVSVFVPKAIARTASEAVRAALALAQHEGLLRSARLGVSSVRDLDWSTAWRRFFLPRQVAPGFAVVPPWRTTHRLRNGIVPIVLDPGMAFGTGRHASTRLALLLLLPYVKAGAAMLDVGCGSGILGIAAAMKGARVFACDIDPLAVRATRENFLRNDVRARAIKRFAGVAPSFPRAPLIAANISSDVLAALVPALAGKLQRGGALVTSGVTRRGAGAVLAAARRSGLRLTDERKSGEWLAHVHVRRAG